MAESVRRSLAVDTGRVRTIHNPIPADSIRPLAQEEAAYPWFADEAPPVVLSVGREAKDYPTLAEAFGLARREVDSRLARSQNPSHLKRTYLRDRTLDSGPIKDLSLGMQDSRL